MVFHNWTHCTPDARDTSLSRAGEFNKTIDVGHPSLFWLPLFLTPMRGHNTTSSLRCAGWFPDLRTAGTPRSHHEGGTIHTHFSPSTIMLFDEEDRKQDIVSYD